MRQIILDTETTGFSPKEGDRIVEIGCVEMINRRVSGEHFHCYLNPERDMPEGAFRVHGLSDEFLADKPKFAEISAEFLEFVAGDELVIHNASFDMAFLDAELQAIGQSTLSSLCPSVVDTLALARSQFPGKRSSLDALCDRFNISRKGRELHGALLDAELLAGVYLALTRGQGSLLASHTDRQRGVGYVKPTTPPELAAKIKVQAASAEDLLAFEAMLQYLDKASGGNTLWRGLLESADAAQEDTVAVDETAQASTEAQTNTNTDTDTGNTVTLKSE